MPKKIKINKQLNVGRPKTAVDKSNLPEKENDINPVKTSYGTLPKQMVGSHMGHMNIMPPKAAGPALPKPPKQPSRGRIAPPSLPKTIK
jgi:hypothetical protein